MAVNKQNSRKFEMKSDKKEHKAQLEKQFHIVGHPKADLLYARAYEFGHSSGYSEVEYFYSELIELIK